MCTRHGSCVGESDGAFDGDDVGVEEEGDTVGAIVGCALVGDTDGGMDGERDGLTVGDNVGCDVVGDKVGESVGY